ncbi:H-NS family nucleoid-associated regulatory protein [Ideonella sp. YS5]|uniref:H-NS family nucleoid-associated regulatory protein n=1 Tax=Ideonella sp. YS5 TaxID=3453714 RepID=UPI003EF001BA
MTAPNRQLLALAEARRLVRDHDISRDELVALEVPRGSSAWERQRRIALDQCRQLVAFWHISPRELRDAPSAPPGPLPPKYRHPVEGHTWDGEGPQPEWLKKALTKEGYTVSELRVAEAAGLS